VVFGVGADLDIERRPPEEATFELEDEPVAPGIERPGKLCDPPVAIGDASSDHRAILLQRDRDAGRGAAAGCIEHVS